jgi:hypothetical protein
LPTWGEILAELNATVDPGTGRPDFDGVRRKYLAELHAYTGNDTILYSTHWMTGGPPDSSITLETWPRSWRSARASTGRTLT